MKRRGSTGRWDVSIDFVSGRIPTGSLEQVAEILDGHDVVLSIEGDRLGVDVTVAAPTHLDAIRAADRLVGDAMHAAGLRTKVRVERVEARSEQRSRADASRPTFPDVLGTAEVADLMGVSKQRVHELRARLPTPLAELRSGPVWARAGIERFLESWDRRPGRPRKAAL